VSREVLVGMAHTAGMNDFYPLDGPRYSNYTRPCVLKPCLFNVGQDATEHNDIADANPAIVAGAVRVHCIHQLGQICPHALH
jgi:hypothetical protein